MFLQFYRTSIFSKVQNELQIANPENRMHLSTYLIDLELMRAQLSAVQYLSIQGKISLRLFVYFSAKLGGSVVKFTRKTKNYKNCIPSEYKRQKSLSLTYHWKDYSRKHTLVQCRIFVYLRSR